MAHVKGASLWRIERSSRDWQRSAFLDCRLDDPLGEGFGMSLISFHRQYNNGIDGTEKPRLLGLDRIQQALAEDGLETHLGEHRVVQHVQVVDVRKAQGFPHAGRYAIRQVLADAMS
eukprot:scaffold1664_cov134-Pinguiococcus_pyrenoidosus.AAC.2